MGRRAARHNHRTPHDVGFRAGRDRSARVSTGQPVRAFVALNFPDPVRRALWEALGPLRDRRDKLPVKWVRAENIHLSLKFLGEVDDAREAELRAALQRAAGAGAESRPLTLQIGGFGVFPDYRRPHVLWAGVTPDPALELLQHGVEQAFEPLGFPTEARAFRPHVTLGRTSRDARPRDFAGLEDVLERIPFDRTVMVSQLDLMHSTLRPEGPVYQVKYHERLS